MVCKLVFLTNVFRFSIIMIKLYYRVEWVQEKCVLCPQHLIDFNQWSKAASYASLTILYSQFIQHKICPPPPSPSHVLFRGFTESWHKIIITWKINRNLLVLGFVEKTGFRPFFIFNNQYGLLSKLCFHSISSRVKVNCSPL